MKSEKHIYFFIGTTAELIKLAPLILELKNRNINFKLVTSGQNIIFFNELYEYLGQLRPDISLGNKIIKPSIFYFLIWTVKIFFKCLFELRHEFKNINKNNTYFVIHGDTVSSLIGALISKIYRLKLVHIESGLRSYNFFEPFPEEICRYIAAKLSDIHFCPNEWSKNNLKKNTGDKINTQQNTLIESFLFAVHYKQTKNFFREINNKYFVLVIHRQEHVIFNRNKTKKILKSVLQYANKDLNCVFITHNLTSNFLKSIKFNNFGIAHKKIIFLPRLPYVDFIALIRDAEYIITDGGSNQEEAYYLGKPCLILRNRTERIEGLNNNIVLTKDVNKIIDFFKNYTNYQKELIKVNRSPSKIIVDYLQK